MLSAAKLNSNAAVICWMAFWRAAAVSMATPVGSTALTGASAASAAIRSMWLSLPRRSSISWAEARSVKRMPFRARRVTSSAGRSSPTTRAGTRRPFTSMDSVSPRATPLAAAASADRMTLLGSVRKVVSASGLRLPLPVVLK